VYDADGNVLLLEGQGLVAHSGVPGGKVVETHIAADMVADLIASVTARGVL
jgi:hypothetical protein